MTYSPAEMRDEHGHWTAGGAVHQVVHSLSGLRGEGARKAITDGHALDTSRVHASGAGGYSEPRRDLHKAIIEHFLSQGVGRPSGKPEAIFTAGGPASGKSSLAGKSTDPRRNLPTPEGHVYINPDNIKEHLPEYQMLKDAGRHDIASSAVHEESSHISKVLTRVAMEHRMPLVVDGVGDSERGKFAGKLKSAREAGYRVTVRYAHVPLDVARQREEIRASQTGRKVPGGVLTNAHRTVSARFNGEIKHMRGVRSEVYSTVGGGKPKLIAVRDPARGRGVNVIDRAAYAEHVAKSTTQPTRTAA